MIITTCAFREFRWWCDLHGSAPVTIQDLVRLIKANFSNTLTCNMSAASRRRMAMWSDSLSSSSAFSDLYRCVTNSDCKLSLTKLTRKCIIALGTESWIDLRTIKKYDLIRRSAHRRKELIKWGAPYIIFDTHTDNITISLFLVRESTSVIVHRHIR